MLHPGIHDLARIRQPYAAAATLKELHPQGSLQPLHLAGQGRLGNIQPLGRMADITFLHDGIEGTHILDFHWRSPLPLYMNLLSYISITLSYVTYNLT